MYQHNFTICNADTDSIMFCKSDMSPFSEDEQESLLNEINNLLPKEIKFSNDGIFKKVIILKAKNYIMVDVNGKVKLKGSALRSSTLEPIIKTMFTEIINLLIADKMSEIKEVYQRYLDITDNITDISPWCTKKTLSPTTYNSTRKNETDIINALKGTEYRSGDRVYVFNKEKTIETGEVYKRTGLPKTKVIKYLVLKEQFDGEYSTSHYRKRVKAAVERFASVLPEGFFN